MESFVQDLRYAVRSLRRSPGFALAAIFTLALAIGANTALFSIVYGVLLRPLPYRDAERLVVVTLERDFTGRARPVPANLWTWPTLNGGIGRRRSSRLRSLERGTLRSRTRAVRWVSKARMSPTRSSPPSARPSHAAAGSTPRTNTASSSAIVSGARSSTGPPTSSAAR